MNCSAFEKELEQLVETRGESLPEPIAAHAMTCDSCRALYRDHQLLEMAIKGCRAVETPLTLAASVLRQLLDHAPVPAKIPSSGFSSKTGWLPVAVSACMLATLGIGVALRSVSIDQSLASKGYDRATPVAEHVLGAPVEVVSSMVAVLDDLRTEYRELAADTTATARDLAVAIPTSPAITWGDMGMSAMAPQPVGPGEEQASGGVTAMGRSIGTQITQAMDFLWTAVPDDIPRG